jgi:hypothetical protein
MASVTEEENIIFKKKHLTVKKLGDCQYRCEFCIENNHIYIEKLVNFFLIEIAYELNKDIFDDYKMQKSSDRTATAFFLFRHFFADIGLKQTYIIASLFQKTDKAHAKFIASTDIDSAPDGIHIPLGAEKLLFHDVVLEYDIVNPHTVNFCLYFDINYKKDIPAFVEKFAVSVFSKMLLRIKQFIENYKL